VWRVDLEAVTDELEGVLGPEERARAARLLNERDRRRWTCSRGVLRALLGSYLRRDPGTLRFATGPRGKPELLDDAGGPHAAPESRSLLSFNLSHSGGVALYAITEAGPVGVDVEVARRPLKEIALAARTFGPAEARRLEGLDPRAREREFLRLWVRHEAELKCRGTGIGGAAAATDGGELWIAELAVGTRGAGAVAVQARSRELRNNHLDLSCWEWRVG